MKCDKCENEAMLHYESTVNGEKTEYHLCEDCARAEGFGEMLDYRPASMLRSFFDDPFFSRPMSLMDSFFGGSPFGALTDGFFGRGGLMAPTMTLPCVRVKVDEKTEADKKSCGCEATEKTAGKADNVSEKVNEEMKAKRELHALKHQLHEAVRAEEYEKAAELRDKIREIEK